MHETCKIRTLGKVNAKQRVENLADEIQAIREKKQVLLLEDANRSGMRKRLEEIEAFLNGQTTEITADQKNHSFR